MSTREIAEITDKRHGHVKRDVKVMTDTLNLPLSNFGQGYLDVNGQEQIEYVLPKNLVFCLIGGYNVQTKKAPISGGWNIRMGSLVQWHHYLLAVPYRQWKVVYSSPSSAPYLAGLLVA